MDKSSEQLIKSGSLGMWKLFPTFMNFYACMFFCLFFFLLELIFLKPKKWFVLYLVLPVLSVH